jgi:hypothetical protein
MQYKKIYLPLKPHLYKFVLREMEIKDGCLILSNKRLLRPATLNPEQYRDYFQRKAYDEDLKMIPVLTVDSRLYKLYAFVQYVDERFSEKMCDYIQLRALPPINQPAKAALRAFMDLYQICESDYGSDSAYKRWQRSIQYKNLKNERNKQKQPV